MTMLDSTLIRAITGTLLAVASSLTLASELQLSDLMQLLAQQKSGRASFIEKKYIGIVDKPLESSGNSRSRRPTSSRSAPSSRCPSRCCSKATA